MAIYSTWQVTVLSIAISPVTLSLSATDKYRRVIYQCNNKFKDKEKCRTPHLDEENIKKLFILALNKMISCREEIFENFNTLKNVIFNTAVLDKELAELQSEMTSTAELIQQCVDENAHTVVNQDEYHSQYEDLVKRFETIKARFNEVTEKRKDKEVRRDISEAFISELQQQSELVTEFDERLWYTLLDHATVYTENDVRFTFKDGTAITA